MICLTLVFSNSQISLANTTKIECEKKAHQECNESKFESEINEISKKQGDNLRELNDCEDKNPSYLSLLNSCIEAKLKEDFYIRQRDLNGESYVVARATQVCKSEVSVPESVKDACRKTWDQKNTTYENQINELQKKYKECFMPIVEKCIKEGNPTSDANNNSQQKPQNNTNTQKCGNSKVESGEECDDGNINSGDGCDSNCQSESSAPPIPQISTIPKPQSTDVGKINEEFRTRILPSIAILVIQVAGAVAVLFIIIGAIQYITAGGDETKFGNAKKTVIFAALGLVIALLSYAIVSLIFYTAYQVPVS